MHENIVSILSLAVWRWRCAGICREKGINEKKHRA